MYGLTVKTRPQNAFKRTNVKRSRNQAVEIRELFEYEGVLAVAVLVPCCKTGSCGTSQRMEFVMTKKKQETDRKRIEGKGFTDIRTIVAATYQRAIAALDGN